MHPKIEDYTRIEKAILFLEENYPRQPELHEVAESVNLSEFHFQRLFRRWAGISPKRFIQFLTLEHAKRLLGDSHSVLDTTYDAGLSSPGVRTHLRTYKSEQKPGGEWLSIIAVGGCGCEYHRRRRVREPQDLVG